MTRKQEKMIKQWVKERDAAVRTFDVEIFKQFYERWQKKGLYTVPLPSDKLIEITIRKMAVHSINLTDEERETAKQWLEERGFSPDK